MSNFIGYVVRYNDDDAENFIKIGTVSRDLFDQETWKRNKIVQVHVVADSTGFVAMSADKLRALMLPLQNHVGGDLPPVIEKRIALEKAI